MSQFSWTKAVVYCGFAFILSGVCQYSVIMPAVESWFEAEQAARDRVEIFKVDKQKIEDLQTILSEKERALAEKEEVIRQLKEQLSLKER